MNSPEPEGTDPRPNSNSIHESSLPARPLPPDTPDWLAFSARNALASLREDSLSLNNAQAEKYRIIKAIDEAVQLVSEAPDLARSEARKLVQLDQQNGEVVELLLQHYKSMLSAAGSLHNADVESRGAAHLLLHIRSESVVSDIAQQLAYGPGDYNQNSFAHSSLVQLVNSLDRAELLEFAGSAAEIGIDTTNTSNPALHIAEHLLTAWRQPAKELPELVNRILDNAERGTQQTLFTRVAAHLFLLESQASDADALDFNSLARIYIGGGHELIHNLLDDHFPEGARQLYSEALKYSLVPAGSALAHYLHSSQGDQTDFLVTLLDDGDRSIVAEACRQLADTDIAEQGADILKTRITAQLLLDGTPESMIELAVLMWNAPHSQPCAKLVSEIFKEVRVSGDNLESLDRSINAVLSTDEQIELSELVFSGYPFPDLLNDACDHHDSLKRENSRFLLWYLNETYGGNFLQHQMKALFSDMETSKRNTQELIRALAMLPEDR